MGNGTALGIGELSKFVSSLVESMWLLLKDQFVISILPNIFIYDTLEDDLVKVLTCMVLVIHLADATMMVSLYQITC